MTAWSIKRSEFKNHYQPCSGSLFRVAQTLVRVLHMHLRAQESSGGWRYRGVLLIVLLRLDEIFGSDSGQPFHSPFPGGPSWFKWLRSYGQYRDCFITRHNSMSSRGNSGFK